MERLILFFEFHGSVFQSFMASPISPAPWLALLLLALSLLSAAAASPSSSSHVPASPSPSKVSYAMHCNSTVPEARPNGRSATPGRSFNFQEKYTYGGAGLFGESVNISDHLGDFYFRPLAFYQTETPGTIMVEATLKFLEMWSIGEPSTKLDLSGFWSEFTGKLCMVGSGNRGVKRPISALLKLNYPWTSTISAAFVGGTVESLDPPHSPNHFGAVALLSYAPENYQYTLIRQAQVMSSFDLGVVEDSTLQDVDVCFVLYPGMRFELEYGADCLNRNCNPFGGGIPGSLPTWFDLRGIGCSADGRLYLYLEFHGASDGSYSFLPTSLVGEGIWDRHSGRASLVACRVGDFRESPLNISVRDCSIGVSFWFQRVLTIESRAMVVGRIWSSRGEGDRGYFPMISLRADRASVRRGGAIPSLRYKFTKTDKIRRFCSRNNSANTRGKSYPAMPFSSTDFRFRMSVNVQNGRDGWLWMNPLSISEVVLDDFSEDQFLLSPLTAATNQSSWNASFDVILDLWNSSTVRNGRSRISAEGTYDSSTGVLCMVGCRRLPYSDDENQTTDCGILINVQLAPLNPEEGDRITGTMRSIRNTSDPLHFKPLSFHSNVLYASQAAATARRMDMELVMVIVSQTLSCFFIRQQLLHARKHPEAVPSISLLMLGVLALGHMMRLLVPIHTTDREIWVVSATPTYHAPQNVPFTQPTVLVSMFGWLEAKEVIARILASVAFLLQFHLLRVTWSARSRKEDSKDLWDAEIKTQLFYLPLYSVANFICFASPLEGFYFGGNGALTSFFGLVVDCFLLPQILFNLFWNSREKTLAPAYYVGTTVVRVLPHLYDAYRNQLQTPRFESSDIYASPDVDFYSTAWNIAVPVVGVLFAVIVSLHQEFGGDCILPKRYRNPPATATAAAGTNQIAPVISGEDVICWVLDVDKHSGI